MAEKPSFEQKGTPKIKLKGQTVWLAWLRNRPLNKKAHQKSS
jgi:hypothetical protein